jgi:hypothetical protein
VHDVKSYIDRKRERQDRTGRGHLLKRTRGREEQEIKRTRGREDKDKEDRTWDTVRCGWQGDRSYFTVMK